MPRLFASYSFHPVGQGLFASGTLGDGGGQEPSFHWVYDCGTSSCQALVTDALDRLCKSVAAGRADKPLLDLVTVSHFDADHISGLTSLLARFRVRILLLPYMPLWQRMAQLADARSYVSRRAKRFLVNPVGFIAALPGAEVDEIVLVPASGTDGQIEGDGDAPQPGDNFPWRLAFDTDEVADDDLRPDRGRANQGREVNAPRVRVLQPGGILRVAGLWEFLPYNDANLQRLPNDAFRLAVEAARERLLNEDVPSLRNDALKALKKIYDTQFGSSAKSRNLISLFLYAGPIGGEGTACEGVFGSVTGEVLAETGRLSHWPRWFWRSGGVSRTKGFKCGRKQGGVLYTGDGSLDNPDRLNGLMAALGSARLTELAGLQVMHHGAKGNWHRGVGCAIAPGSSIFSSDPNHRGLRHPHADVWADFAPYRPFQVNRCFGFALDVAYW